MPGTEQPLAHRSNTVGHSRDGLRPNVTASSGRRLNGAAAPTVGAAPAGANTGRVAITPVAANAEKVTITRA
jgi:hypothetical protein